MPEIGEWVLYVLGGESNHAGEVRPALVVRVWSQTIVNLIVFGDGENDKLLSPNGWVESPQPRWLTSIELDDDHAEYTWHRAA